MRTIALLVPVTSRGREVRTMARTALFRRLVPSLLATATWREGLRYRVYVGYDAGDPFYDHPARRRAAERLFRRRAGTRPVQLVLNRCEGSAHAPCVAWNALFRRAYDDGADFFYQLGDDLALVTAGWARDFPAALLLNPTRPGLGVTGPVDTQVGGRILTQSFVSRQHMEVFGAYYPSAFRNWWSDDWITQVYAPEHTRLWTHHFVRNGRGWPRYHVDFASRSRLEAEVERGRTALAAALARPSAARGPSRRIIAFSLWGSAPRYLVGAVRNAELAREHYPGWTCRFYVGDVPVATVARLAAMPNVELVGMGRGGWKGLFWRFLPASEEDVEVVIVRDVDSRLGARERAAVDAWLAGDKDVHIMRDHPEHEAAMLAGMWGVRRGRLWDLRGRIALFTRGRARPFADQRFLAHEVYPRVREHACVHDPFFEKRPFPTARRGGRFVGQPYDEHGRPL